MFNGTWFDQGQVWPACWMVMASEWRSRMMEPRGHKIYVDGGLLCKAVLALWLSNQLWGADSFTLGGPDDATIPHGWMNYLRRKFR